MAYLANYFSQNLEQKLLVFIILVVAFDLDYTFIKSIKWNLSNILNYKNFGIYKSFGARKIIRPVLNLDQDKRAQKIYYKELKKIKKNTDIYKFTFNKVPYGDLFYDTYLKRFYEPTIKIDTKRFKNFFQDFIRLIVYWEDYLNKNHVKAVVGVHGQYSYAIIHRLAAIKNIPVILHAEGKIYKINKKNLYTHSEFYFIKKFNLLSKEKKLDARAKGLEVLKIEFQVVVALSQDILIYQNPLSKIHTKTKKIIIKQWQTEYFNSNSRFFDAINIYGRFIFNDFYEWLYFLGHVSKKLITIGTLKIIQIMLVNIKSISLLR